MPTEITRDLPYAEAMAALADYAKRLAKPRFAKPVPQRGQFNRDRMRYLDQAEKAGLLPQWPVFEFEGHGDPRIDNSDGFATTMLMCLCNHSEPAVANEARRVLDCFQANMRCIVRAPR